MMRFRLKIIIVAGLIFSVAFAVGCATNPEPKTTAFKKWKEMAEKSRGYSPRARKRTIDLPPKDIETIAPHLADQQPPKPLPTRKITMKMHQTDVAVLLRALARAVNLNIMINESVSGRISINVIDAKWDQVFMGILNSQGLAYEWQGDIIRIITYEDRDRNFKNLEADGKILAKKREMERQAPLITKIIPIDYANAENLKNSVEKVLSANKPGEPIGSVVVDTHTNALIIQATPSDIRRIVPLVVELDRPTKQILIEAHIVETTNRTARELGVQWGGLLYNSDQDLWLSPDAIGDSQINPGSGDIVNPAGGPFSNFPANLGNATQAGTGFNLGIIAQGTRGILSLQLSALEEQGELNILSSPSITTLDNIKAVIESGDQVPIPIVENDNVEVVYKSALLSLEVTPHVIQDDVLKLEIVTTKDELDFARSVSLYPTIISKKASTNVILFDGQTTVIGGLKKNTDAEIEAGIPWFRRIPLLGYLFKNDSRRYEMEDILIFITPHILQTQPEAGTSE